MGKEQKVLSDVEFELEGRSLNCLLGPSGSGKTTLLNIISGLDRADKGQVLLEGKKVDDLRHSAKRKIRSSQVGIIYQNPNLLGYLTVTENVMLPALFEDEIGTDLENSADKLLDRLDLTTKKNTFPTKLSEGERRRVSVARGVIAEPRLILADEPTVNLDPGHARSVLEILRESRDGGACVLLSTHDVGISAWSDRTMKINYGRVS